MIDYNRLAFPGGIAVAAILKSPGAGMKKAQLLIVAALGAAALQLYSQWSTAWLAERAMRKRRD